MSAMFKGARGGGGGGSALSENVPEIENEPFLDEAERAANADIQYPGDAPKTFTPGKTTTGSSSLASGISGMFGMPRKLSFSVQLAHGSPVRKIGNFKSVKELYDRVGETFPEIDSPAEIMFCTLNSYSLLKNMENLLGGQIMLTDFIYVHVKSKTRKRINIYKSDSALGLTITDNGAGIAFIKRVREGSIVARVADVKIGDHIEAINDQSTVGWRHFEVAKKLRAIPIGQQFTMVLVEPLRSEFDNIAPRKNPGSQPQSTHDLADLGEIGDGNRSIRFRSHGNAEMQEEMPTDFIIQAQLLIDDELEKYIGIRDPALASDIYDFWTSAEDADKFATDLDEALGEGIIPDDAIFKIDEALRDLRSQFK